MIRTEKVMIGLQSLTRYFTDIIATLKYSCLKYSKVAKFGFQSSNFFQLLCKNKITCVVTDNQCLLKYENFHQLLIFIFMNAQGLLFYLFFIHNYFLF